MSSLDEKSNEWSRLKVKIKAQIDPEITEATNGSDKSEGVKPKTKDTEDFKAKDLPEASAKIEADAVNDCNLVDEPTIFSTELSNMSLSVED